MLLKPKWCEPVGDGCGKGRPVRFEKGRWHHIEARDVPSANFAIPLAGSPIEGANPASFAIGERSYPIEPFLRLVGWYVAEGCAGPTGIGWSQCEGQVSDLFTATFAEAGVEVSVGWQEPRAHVGPNGRVIVGTRRGARWYVGNRTCRDLVMWFKQHCGLGQGVRKVPDAIFDLSPRLKRVFLDAYLQGDGTKRRKAFSATTISKKLCDDLMRLAVEIGVHTSCQCREPKYARQQMQYISRFGTEGRREVAMRTSRNLTRERYVGLVWCLTVPTGVYFVRRNGKVTACSNSAHWFNKCDHGLIVHRESENVTKVVIAKSRFEEAGVRGVVKYSFDKSTLSLDYLDRGDQASPQAVRRAGR
jgi:LAGLIDADG-like domain